MRPPTSNAVFQTGDRLRRLYLAPRRYEQLKMLGFANINLYGSSDYSQVEFNVHRPALQDKRVRQALIYGLDRQKLIRRGLSGVRQSRHRADRADLLGL
ncbi:ABC transporter substrate-binding protein [Klebsiella pneumoniae]|uniref:ABC transporter substrate-binding protein n=1 Tax=Klebsiella pneumoniae TaxID=573 RepID=UPI002B45C115|nr:ABC transporter substrate-binding protein [Klebsiella pneumoniae]